MEIQEAFHIFEIDDPTLYISKTDLKKRYCRLALKYHPDKNLHNPRSTEHFQKITEAYELLKNELQEGEKEDISSFTKYTDFLDMFLKENPILSTLFSFIHCDSLTIQLFENMNKNDILDIYHYFFQYRQILHISDKWLETLKKIIVEKYQNIHIYTLRPSLSELFTDRIYKLEVNHNIYYVPLWHNELEFDDKDEIIVKCDPILPDNIMIDEHNNILVNIIIQDVYSLFKEDYLDVHVGDNISPVKIPICRLFIKKQQYYIFKKMGILRIREKDIYNCDERSDIIVNIHISTQVQI